MANSEAKLSPQEVFNNKKIFSNKIHARVLKVTEEILKSFDKLNIANDEDKNLFLNAVNHYYRDLCAVIFQLRLVTSNFAYADQGVLDLQNVITELTKIVLIVQESLNLELENLKIQLKSTIVNVGFQVEKLMEVIQYDNLHEHKQKVLDCQHDLVISVEALKLYCQVSYLSSYELEALIHGVLDKIKNNLIQMKTGHELMAEDFSHYTRHSVQNLQIVVNYMRKMINTENYRTDIEQVLLNSELCSIEYISDLMEAVRYGNPMNKMLDIIENCHKNVTKCTAELQKGLQAAAAKNNGEKVDVGVKQLIIHIFLCGLNAMTTLNQSIEDAIMKK